jgi:hypothetical protein
MTRGSLPLAAVAFCRSPPDEGESENEQVLGSTVDTAKKPFAAFVLAGGF